MNKWAGVCLISIFFAGNVSASQNNQNPIQIFSLDIDFCAYMVSPPGFETQKFIEKYEVALNFAVDAMRQQEPKITYTQAIFSLRSLCDETLSKPMSIQP